MAQETAHRLRRFLTRRGLPFLSSLCSSPPLSAPYSFTMTDQTDASNALPPDSYLSADPYAGYVGQEDYSQYQAYQQDLSQSQSSLSQSGQLSELSLSQEAKNAAECNIYINALPKEINDEKLTQIFCTFGDIESARVMVDFNTRISRGYGFVKFKTPEAAKNAIQTMDGFQLGTNTLNVKFANESVLPKQTPSNNILKINSHSFPTFEVHLTLFTYFHEGITSDSERRSIKTSMQQIWHSAGFENIRGFCYRPQQGTSIGSF